MRTEFGQEQKLREAEPKDRFEATGLFRQATIEQLLDHQVDRSVETERRRHKPVGHSSISGIRDVGRGKGRKARPLQNLLQPVGGGEPKRQPRNRLLLCQIVNPTARVAASYQFR